MIRSTNSDNLLTDNYDAIIASARQAVQEALWEHKLLGNSVATSENGIVKIIQSEDLVLDERFNPIKLRQKK